MHFQKGAAANGRREKEGSVALNAPQQKPVQQGPVLFFLRNAVGGVPYISVLPLMAVKLYLYPVIGKICQILAQYDNL